MLGGGGSGAESHSLGEKKVETTDMHLWCPYNNRNLVDNLTLV